MLAGENCGRTVIKDKTPAVEEILMDIVSVDLEFIVMFSKKSKLWILKELITEPLTRPKEKDEDQSWSCA